MNKIIQKQQFSEKVFKFEIEAPLIAKSRKAGNFVIIRVDKNSERMPLTIADADTHRGTITLVVQEVGLSSRKLCRLSEGDYVEDVVGPLGSPTYRTSAPWCAPEEEWAQHPCCPSSRRSRRRETEFSP